MIFVIETFVKLCMHWKNFFAKHQIFLLFLNIYILSFIVHKFIELLVPLHFPTLSSSCNFNNSEEVNSSQRDVIFFYSTSIKPQLNLAIKSLRSTGCKSRIIFFYSEKYVDPSFRYFAAFLNVEVIPNCKDSKKREFNPHMLRYEFEYKWLQEHLIEVDRIFHSDSFDVFFQGDPFSRYIHYDKITFVVEPHCIRSCGWNLAWIQQCYGNPSKFDMNQNFIICSGSISGSANEYLRLLHLMINTKEWKSCWYPSMDQPILNWLVWNEYVKKENISYELSGCDGGFFTMQWCVLEKKIIFNENQQIQSIGGNVPAYVHQYNRFPNLTKHLFQICNI